jgi:hypothetical protein
LIVLATLQLLLLTNYKKCFAQKSGSQPQTVTFTIPKAQADEIAKTIAIHPLLLSQRDTLKKQVQLLHVQVEDLKQAWNIDTLTRSEEFRIVIKEKEKYKRRSAFFSKSSAILGIILTSLFLLK